MASSFFLIRLLRKITAVPRPSVRSAITTTIIPTSAPMESVTPAFESDDAVFDEIEMTTPVPVAVAAAAPILLVNVLAYVVVSVVESWFAVKVFVYSDVKTE